MGNSFSDRPILSEPFPSHTRLWRDPITGLSVPKDPAANLQWRSAILTAAETDRELQQDLYTACSQSVLYFVNAFCFTLRVFEPKDGGSVKQAEHQHLPFVTWPIQDTHILRIEQCIEDGESLLTDKSRDMGATWDHLAVYAKRLIFHKDESHLMLSRKEDSVDMLDGAPKGYPYGAVADPGTLFGKIDYILGRLPEWMMPRLYRKAMHIVNRDNRTRIDGESSNATAGSSDRRTSIFLDEMAKMDEAEAIKRSTKDVTACRLPCSTPNGAGTAYSTWRQSGTIPVFELPWWEHPEKGHGRYAKQDQLGRWKIRSPWYDQRCAEDTPKEIATELDMDHVGSGETFFESVILDEHKKLHARPARLKLTVNWRKGMSEEQVTRAANRREIKDILAVPDGGPLRVWLPLDRGRLDQTKTYTVGIDISKGQGASNSVMSILCNETREKVCEWADANTPPYDLARIACAVCVWVGGRHRPLMIWENNGDPGFDFGRQVTNVYHYPNVYFDRRVGTTAERKGKRYGWRSTPEKKATCLGLLRRAYAFGGIINHSEEAIGEALTYINYESGGIGPAGLVSESDSARKTHGDRVIGDMLCVVGAGEAPKNRVGTPEVPRNSVGYRLKQFQRAKKAEKNKDRFNFSEVS